MAHEWPSYAANCGIFGTFLALTWIVVLLRFYVKSFILRTITIDDWFLAAALVTFTTIMGLFFPMLKMGLGKHQSDIPASAASKIYHEFFVCELLYVITTVAVKLSISVLLLRIAVVRAHRLIIISTAVFYSFCGVVFCIVMSLQCIPTHDIWKVDISKLNCIPAHAFVALLQTNAAISFVTDLIFGLIPVTMLWGVQMERGTKIVTAIILGLGLSITAVNAARFSLLTAYGDLSDRSYQLYGAGVVSMLEVGVGIIVSSLATLRPLLRMIASLLSRSMGSISRVRSFPRSRLGSVAKDEKPTVAALTATTSSYSNGTMPNENSSKSRQVDADADMWKLTEQDKADWANTCRSVELRATEATKEGKAQGAAAATEKDTEVGWSISAGHHPSDDTELPELQPMWTYEDSAAAGFRSLV